METLFAKLVSLAAEHGPEGIAFAVLIFCVGAEAVVLYKGLSRELAAGGVVTTALLEAAKSQDRITDQFQETNRTRDALVAALGANSFDIKTLAAAIVHEGEMSRAAMTKEGELNRANIANLTRSIDQLYQRARG